MPKFQPKMLEDHKGKMVIEILDGPFVGTLFTLDNLKVAEENEDGSANLTFDYNIHYMPENIESTREMLDEEVGQILEQIILQTIEWEKKRDENRDNNPEQSTNE